MTSSVPATWDSSLDTGLEEFDVNDAVIPRLSIVHKDGLFKDSLSNETFDTLHCIILGLVKQRSLWHPTVDEGDWPMCRSANFETGIPNLSDEQPKDKRFNLLWSKAGFDPADYPPDENGVIRLPCAGCQLKEWGSHPDGKKPYCSEQFTLAVLYDPEGNDAWVPAVITFQKTSLKPLKAYLSSFARSRNAAFMAVTDIKLDVLKRGQTEYSVPNFRKVGSTDEGMWREYSSNYRAMADFLRQEPVRKDDDDTPPATSGNVATPPKSAPQDDGSEDIVEGEVVEDQQAQAEKVTAPPEATAAPAAAADDDDDLPF